MLAAVDTGSTANPVESLATLPSQSGAYGLVEINGRFLFVASTPATGSEIWTSDGTQEGTHLLKELRPGSASGMKAFNDLNPYPWSRVGDTLFFSGADAGGRAALWKTDGTAAGTVMVRDFNTGYSVSFLGPLTASQDGVYFAALFLDEKGNPVVRAWRSDGTTQGTEPVSDVNLSTDGLSTVGLLGDAVYYFGERGPDSGLWKTDSHGTTLIGSSESLVVEHEPQFVPLGDRLLFVGTVGILGVTDGTPTGTRNLGNVGYVSSYRFAREFVRVGGFVFFAGRTVEAGLELWQSDGTPEGTRMVADLNAGPGDGIPLPLPAWNYLGVAGGRLFFPGTSGGAGYKLYSTDGTGQGVQVVRDLGLSGSQVVPAQFANVDGRLFFGSIYHGIGTTDGTAQGTVLFGQSVNMNTFNLPRNPVVRADGIYFVGMDGFWKLASNDDVAPRLVSRTYRNSGLPEARFTFSEDVSASVPTAEFSLANLDTRESYTILSAQATTSVIGRDVDVRFTGFPRGIPPDANYRLTVRSGTIRDIFGNAIAVDGTLDFFRLTGDFNQDRRVDIADFTTLAIGFNKPSNAAAVMDLDGSGRIDIDDFAIFAPQFGKTLPPPAGRAFPLALAPTQTRAGFQVDRLIQNIVA